MKKLPLPLSGLILGQLGLGNLLAIYHPYFRFGFGIFATVLLILLTLSTLLYSKQIKQEFSNPTLVSSFAPYPMSVILLSGYAQAIPTLSFLAPILWWLGLVLDLLLIMYFTLRFVLSYQRDKLTPSWTVLYVGIATASLTVSVTQQHSIGQFIIDYGLIASMILFPLLFEKFSKESLAVDIEAQVFIFAAPLSLLLAASIQVFGKDSNSLYIWILLILSQLIYLAVLSRLPQILKNGFKPAWSALTFPIVISALSFRLALNVLGYTSNFPFLLSKIEDGIALCLVTFVTYRYLQFLKKGFSKY